MSSQSPKVIRCMCGHPMTHATIHAKNGTSSHLFYQDSVEIAIRLGLTKRVYAEEDLPGLREQIDQLELPKTKEDFLKAYEALTQSAQDDHKEAIIGQRETEIMFDNGYLDPEELYPIPCRGPEVLPRMRGLPY